MAIRSPSQLFRVAMILALCATPLLLLFLWPTYFSLLKSVSSCNHLEYLYGIIFDAGSSGSRIHVYKFQKEDSFLSLKEEFYKEVEPGLSSYNSAVDAADSLLPLLDCAKAFIPEKYQRKTPLLLKATAGLRQIGEEEAQKILDEVRNLFRKQPFSFSDENNQVSILDGGDEGLFAWVTVNYLEGFLGQSSEPTCGILDLGGGSTQIAFAVEPTISKGLGGRVKQHRFGNQTYAVYTHSIPGYGLYSARKAVLLNANSSGVCVLPYYKGVWENVTVMGGKDVLGNNEKCEQFIVSSFFQTKEECVNQDPLYRCLVDGALQPVLTNRHFHAFSFYYDRAADLRLLKDHRTMLAPRAYKDAAEKVCGLKEDAVKSTYTVLKEGDVRFLCLDNLYIYALLSHLGFSDDQQLHITRKLNGFETGWCLGAMVHYLMSLE